MNNIKFFLQKMSINVSKILQTSVTLKNQKRFLPRWAFKRPTRVIPPDAYDPLNDKAINISTQNSKDYISSTVSSQSNQEDCKDETSQKTKKIVKNRKPLSVGNAKGSFDMLETVIDGDGNLIYTKMGNKDTRVTSLLTPIKSKKDAKNLVLLEGKRLIKEALISGCTLKYILFSRKDEVEFIQPYLPKFGIKLYKMPYKEIQLWSNLQTSPGIIGVINRPTVSINSENTLPLTVICDNIRDPNNLGAILRVCGGVGCKQVFLTKGCTDMWDSKVLRASAGCHFKLNIQDKKTWDDIKENLDNNSTIFIADNKTSTTDSQVENSKHTPVDSPLYIPLLPYCSLKIKNNKHVVLVVGGETEGISENSYNFAKEFGGFRLNIPLDKNIDSLNSAVALGVIAFEIKRQFTIPSGDHNCVEYQKECSKVAM